MLPLNKNNLKSITVKALWSKNLNLVDASKQAIHQTIRHQVVERRARLATASSALGTMLHIARDQPVGSRPGTEHESHLPRLPGPRPCQNSSYLGLGLPQPFYRAWSPGYTKCQGSLWGFVTVFKGKRPSEPRSITSYLSAISRSYFCSLQTIFVFLFLLFFSLVKSFGEKKLEPEVVLVGNPLGIHGLWLVSSEGPRQSNE